MLKGIFKKWDLTRQWKPSEGDSDLRFDLDSHRLCGVGVGEPFSGLGALGRPDASFPTYDDAKKTIIGSDYVWLALGLTVRAQGDRVASFEVDTTTSGSALRFTIGGRTIDFKGMRNSDMVATLGPPTETDEIPIMVFYDFPEEGVQWTVDFGEGGTVDEFILEGLERTA